MYLTLGAFNFLSASYSGAVDNPRPRTLVQPYRNDGLPRKNYDECMDHLVAKPDRYAVSLTLNDGSTYVYKLNAFLGLGTTHIVFSANETSPDSTSGYPSWFPVVLRLPISADPRPAGNSIRARRLFDWARQLSRASARISRDVRDEGVYREVFDFPESDPFVSEQLGYVIPNSRAPRVARLLNRWALSSNGLVRFFVQDYVPGVIPFLDLFLLSEDGTPLYSVTDFEAALADLRSWLLRAYAVKNIFDFNLTALGWLGKNSVKLPGELSATGGMVLIDIGDWREAELAPERWSSASGESGRLDEENLAQQLLHTLSVDDRRQILGTALALREAKKVSIHHALGYARTRIEGRFEVSEELRSLGKLYENMVSEDRISRLISLLDEIREQILAERMGLLTGDSAY